jgi:hypothetical protein
MSNQKVDIHDFTTNLVLLVLNKNLYCQVCLVVMAGIIDKKPWKGFFSSVLAKRFKSIFQAKYMVSSPVPFQNNKSLSEKGAEMGNCNLNFTL